MNYSTDRPINTCEQDLLGRSSFSKQLGRAIYDYNENFRVPYTITNTDKI